MKKDLSFFACPALAGCHGKPNKVFPASGFETDGPILASQEQGSGS